MELLLRLLMEVSEPKLKIRSVGAVRLFKPMAPSLSLHLSLWAVVMACVGGVACRVGEAGAREGRARIGESRMKR